MRPYVRIVPFLLSICSATAFSSSPKQHYVIGGWISSAEHVLLEKWSPLFETYLTETVGSLYNPPISFKLIPFDYDNQTSAKALVEAGEIDFAYHSGGGITCLEAQFGFTSIATQVQMIAGHEESSYGAVIYSLKSNAAITNISDFRGKRLGVGYPLAPGGFQLGAQVVFYMNDYAGLLNGIIVGDVDVAITQSGWIETNLPEYLPKLRFHKVVNSSWYSIPYSLATTTHLVPHFAVSAGPEVPQLLQEQVSRALTTLNASHPAAKAAGISRFTLPASYEPVRALVEKLGIMRATADGGKTCLDVFSGLDKIISCPAGYAIERSAALHMRCRTDGLSCPAGVTCFCRPCHPDGLVNIFPWQIVLGLCCALFAVGLCFSLGWVTLLQAEELGEEVVSKVKQVRHRRKWAEPDWYDRQQRAQPSETKGHKLNLLA